jgi:CRP/FNR family transcriptional regulator
MIESTSQKEQIKEQIGFLFEEELMQEIYQVGKIKKIPADSILVDNGDEILHIPFVIDGSVKISRDKDDSELLLYYIESGDTCTMTLQCSVTGSVSEVRATALEDSEVLLIPVMYMENWMNKYPSWRRYILESYHSRMLELMETVDAIAFMRLDERLEKYLTDQAKLTGSLEIHHTHQQIAEDLHSSRVVISRLLKQLEQKGRIQLYRNRIVLGSI